MADEKKVDGQGTVVDPDNGAAQPVQPKPEVPPAGGANPNGSTSKEYKFKVDGKEYEFDDKELLEVISMGLDYTKKTMVMADERKDMQPFKPFIKRMNTDPVFNRAVTDAVDDIVASQDTNLSNDGSDPQLLAEVAGLRQQVANMVTQGQFDVLESKYPEETIDRSSVADFMLANNIANPEHAYIIMNQGILTQKATLKGLEEGKIGAVDANKVMVSPGRSGIKTEPAVDVKNMSKLDKKKRAEKLLEGLRRKT